MSRNPEELLHYAHRVADKIHHVRRMNLERHRASWHRDKRIEVLRALLLYGHGKVTKEDLKEHFGWSDPDEILRDETEDWDDVPFDPNDWPDHWLNQARPSPPEGCHEVEGLLGTPEDLNHEALEILDVPMVMERGMDSLVEQFLRQKEYEATVADYLVKQTCMDVGNAEAKHIWMLRLMLRMNRYLCTDEKAAGLMGVSMDRLERLVDHELSYELGDDEVRDPDVIDAVE